jgi:hypothetical protein
MKKTIPHVILAVITVIALTGLSGLSLAADTFRASVVAGIADTNRNGVPDGFYNGGSIDSAYYIQKTPQSEIRNISEYNLSPYAGMTLTSASLKMAITANNGYGAKYRQYNVCLYPGNGHADLIDFSAAGTLCDTLSYDLNQNISSVTDYIDIRGYLQNLLNNSIFFVGIRVNPITENDYGTVVGSYYAYFDNNLTIEAVPEPCMLALLALGGLAVARRRKKWEIFAEKEWLFCIGNFKKNGDWKIHRTISGIITLGFLISYSFTSPCLAYKAIILQPDGVVGSIAYAVNENVQVGQIIQSTPQSSASGFGAVWQSTSIPSYLSTYVSNSATGSTAYDIDGSQIVGIYGGFKAAVWTNGTPGSYHSIHPAGFECSWALGAYHGWQVGSGEINANGPERALMWNGTAQSVVNLHPNNYWASRANAIYNNAQVGFGTPQDMPNYQYVALMWNGSAQSVTILQPSGFYRSEAKAVWGDYQAGYVTDMSMGTHAVIWHGTAASMIDLHPSGYVASCIDDACGVYQVGVGWTANSFHALLWQGSSSSFVDLQTFLPPEYVRSRAYGVDALGNVVGVAYLSGSNYGQAVLWQIPEPCTLALLALGGVGLFRRRKA